MKLLDRTGEIHKTNEGYEIEIIKYKNYENCDIKFLNFNYIIKGTQYGIIKRGNIKNVYHKSFLSVGYFGEGTYKACTKVYQTWISMMDRGYNNKYKLKFPTYKNVTVCEEWHNFQNFGKWFEENYVEGYVLDKDIIVKGNKVYSPDTCTFVPNEVNSLIIKSNSIRGDYPIGVSYKPKINKYQAHYKNRGKTTYIGVYYTPQEAFDAYKKVKEEYLKISAEKWKDKIDSRVYEALINYTVEITD